jgi:hypothetical protein
MDTATAAQAPIEAPVSAPEGERVYVAVGINAWGTMATHGQQTRRAP